MVKRKYKQKDGTLWEWEESDTLKEYIKNNKSKSDVTDTDRSKTSEKKVKKST